MKRYEEYCAAPYDWLPELPSHWKQLYVQQVSHEKKVKNVGMAEKLVLSLSYGRIIRKKNVDSGLVAKDLSTYQIVDKNDIILRLTDLQNDHKSLRTGLVKERGIISSAYICIVPTINPTYLQYLLHSYDTRKVFYGMGGGVRQSISFDDIRHMYVPVPPRAEQDQIVHYLDWKVSKINHLIHGYEQQIKLLKERRVAEIDAVVVHGIGNFKPRLAKVKWMGNIPSHWKSMRMKNFFREINERSLDGHEPHLSMSQKKGLVTDDADIERRLLSESYAGAKICQKDDLVLNRLKAHLGVFALAPQLGGVSPDYTVLRLDLEKVRPKYAEYLLKSNACRGELKVRVRGIVEGFWRLYTDDLGSIPVCIPSLDEQDEILKIVSEIESRYKAAIPNLQKEISLLREYRTRLISDVVTGQIDVRDEVIPDYTPEEDCEVESKDTETEEVNEDDD